MCGKLTEVAEKDVTELVFPLAAAALAAPLVRPTFDVSFLDWLEYRLTDMVRTKLDAEENRSVPELLHEIKMLILLRGVIITGNGLIPRFEDVDLVEHVGIISRLINPWDCDEDGV